jgi:tetratricopeptide (TPR) repeat protein
MDSISDVRALTAKFRQLGCDPEFADFVERILVPRARDPGAWLDLAATLRRQGAYEAALHTYDAAARRFPNISQIPNNKGVLLRECGLFNDALIAFDEALHLNPSYVTALLNRGNVLEYLSRFGDAEKSYRRLLEIEPGSPTAWNNLGNCAQQLGNKNEARHCYERAIKLDPNYVIPLVNLAGLIDELGDRAKAIGLVKQALYLDSQDEEAKLLMDRFLQQEAARTLEPPAWDHPSFESFIKSTLLLDVIERQERERRLVPELLKRSMILSQRAGFLAWDPDRMAADPEGDPGPSVVRLSPATPEAPRLYISYAWSQDDFSKLESAYNDDLLVDELAGYLFSAGYKIVYDRDPRTLNKGFSELHVLRRLYDCNFFIAVLTERYLAKISPGASARGMAGAEWDLADQLAQAGFLSFIGVWLSGEPLPTIFNEFNTIDLREHSGLVMFDENIRKMFPRSAAGQPGVPKLTAHPRPPEPADWPKYVP